MKTNVVLIERTTRMGLGMLLFASPLLELHSYPFNLLGLVLIATAAIGYCPIYELFSAVRRDATSSAKPRLLSKVTNDNVQAHPRPH
jgi:hypothetical protein